MGTPQQGDIYTILLGDEEHYVVIISDERFNQGDYVVAVLVTSKHFERRSKLPNCTVLSAGTFCFTKDCVAQAESIAQISRDELIDYRATLDGEAIRNMIRSVGVVIGAECEPGSCL